MPPMTRPQTSEFAEYYATYVNQVGDGDVRQTLARQAAEVPDWLRAIPDDRVGHRYAPDKWTIRQVLSHINDSERVFSFRAFWFARGFDSPMPSFDQAVAIPTAAADDRSWASHIAEFEAIRGTTLALVNHFPADAWDRRGIASGNPVTVRALVFIVAGHLEHHLRILRERYL
jgi:hypothetical protein